MGKSEPTHTLKPDGEQCKTAAGALDERPYASQVRQTTGQRDHSASKVSWTSRWPDQAQH